MDTGKVATDYQAPELTVTDVETEITSTMLLADSLSVGVLDCFIYRCGKRPDFPQEPERYFKRMS